MNGNKTRSPILPQQSVQVMKLIGKAIAQRPVEVRRLLASYNITVRNGNEAPTLSDAVLYGLSRNNQNFNKSLSDLLSKGQEDNFLGAIAGAVGSVANVIGGAQQNKALKEQARSQTLASVLAYKAQADQTRTEQLKIQQNQKQNTKPKSANKTVLIISGIIIALLILGVVFHQSNAPGSRQPVTPSTH